MPMEGVLATKKPRGGQGLADSCTGLAAKVYLTVGFKLKKQAIPEAQAGPKTKEALDKAGP
eukprot:1146914-Pelagomonas_calceolata.AAC.22